ncbi:hypothetical protein AV530_009822 [Patagioenas fasciata monilis]|uniref:Uncharacterized protein n=1 Tax=Patagioenas fasciata monilis TaxID=372326 RepID=A0A1V4KAD0_PATFA|nr:hypothetical protein AV530_009822 [Patagioenas fasciata monilis]
MKIPVGDTECTGPKLLHQIAMAYTRTEEENHDQTRKTEARVMKAKRFIGDVSSEAGADVDKNIYGSEEQVSRAIANLFIKQNWRLID